MADMNAIYAQAIAALEARTRFDETDDLLSNPTDAEKEVALDDALAEINAGPPASAYTYAGLFPDAPAVGDARVIRLLYLGAARNIIHLLVLDWTANGFSTQFDVFNVEDRLQRYQTLEDSLTSQLNDELTKFKAGSSQSLKLARGPQSPISRPRGWYRSSGASSRYWGG